MSKNNVTQTVILLRDDVVAYLILEKDNDGFFIKDYEQAELDKDFIVNGELLKIDLLQKILFKIRKKILTKDIHLLIPHKHFDFDIHTLDMNSKKSVSKQILKYLKKNKSSISWAKTHGYEYDTFVQDKNIKLFFRTLAHEMHESYTFLFKKAGFNVLSIQSDMLAFQKILPQKGRVSQFYIGQEKSYLIDYKDGMYISEKIFNFSYKQLLSDIQKELSISQEEAEKILKKYGLLRGHPDKRVYTKLYRRLNPVFDFLKKRKNKEKIEFFVHGVDFPLLGFVHHLRLTLPFSVNEFSFHENDVFKFHEVLSLHKKDSYFFEPLIVRALALFDKKK